MKENPNRPPSIEELMTWLASETGTAPKMNRVGDVWVVEHGAERVRLTMHFRRSKYTDQVMRIYTQLTVNGAVADFGDRATYAALFRSSGDTGSQQEAKQPTLAPLHS